MFVRRFLASVLAAVALCSVVVLGLSACQDDYAPLTPTEMLDVTPSHIDGLEAKTKPKSFKDTLTATVTVTPAYGRVVQFERYDSQTKEWVPEQEYETADEPSAQVTVEFGPSWKQHGSSTWRLVAPAMRNAGPEREILGEVVAKTKVVNAFFSGWAAVVMDAETGKLLYDYHAKDEHKIASMTKMMSAIVLMEHKQPSDIIKITKEIWATEYSFGFSKGDPMTVEQILYSMMLPSANDAAAAAAYGVSGSIEKFAKLMDSKAADIGCKNTVFKNPHGLDAEGAHSTAYDAALMGRYIMTSDTCELVRKAIKAKDYKFTVSYEKTKKDKKTGKKKKKTVTHAYALENTNELLNDKDKSIGIKTGYTEAAGACFCGAIEIEGKVYITVIMGADAGGGRWDDTRALNDFARYAVAQGLEPYDL